MLTLKNYDETLINQRIVRSMKLNLVGFERLKNIIFRNSLKYQVEVKLILFLASRVEEIFQLHNILVI